MSALTRVLALAALVALAMACVSPVAAKADRPDRLPPTACTVAPRVAADVVAATPMPEQPKAVAHESDERTDSPADLPPGEPADPETVAQITAAAREFAACFNAADESRLAALMTDGALAAGLSIETFTPLFAATGTPEAGSGETPWEIVWLRLRNVRALPDGRVSAVVFWGMTDNPQLAPIPESTVHVFARGGDRWLLDAKRSDTAASDVDPILSRGRQGFMEVDSAMYAEPTMAGAKFSIEAMVMVGFVGNDDPGAVSCEMFIFERGADSATVSAFCRADEALLGRAAYLDVQASGPHHGSESAASRCEDAALLAASLVFSCTVDVPEATP